MLSFFKFFTFFSGGRTASPKASLHISSNPDLREFVAQSARFVLEQSCNPTSAPEFVLEDVQVTAAGAAFLILKPLNDSAPADDARVQKRVQKLRGDMEREIAKITGISKVTMVMTGAPPAQDHTPIDQNQGHKNADLKDHNLTNKMPPVPLIIAVSSGKGGVGKSTVAINLALALARLGRRVGVLDSDIYGPSIPRLAGVPQARLKTDDADKSDLRPDQADEHKIAPIMAHGLKLMSIGFMVDETTPMIWRGPMVQSALLQMVRDVDWSGLDILVLDMPPGTGDIHLTIAQKIPLSGAVVVSTPQDIALIDARKGLEMFKKVAVPILGIVENMSYFICPSCGHREDIFGAQGARKEAEKLNVPFLGEVPLHAKIREFSDLGTPVTVAEPDSPQAASFINIAENILRTLDQGQEHQKPAPKIIMED